MLAADQLELLIKDITRVWLKKNNNSRETPSSRMERKLQIYKIGKRSMELWETFRCV